MPDRAPRESVLSASSLRGRPCSAVWSLPLGGAAGRLLLELRLRMRLLPLLLELRLRMGPRGV